MKLLLIDDNEIDREAVKRTLRHHQDNIVIKEASTAHDGIRTFESDDFDIVLLDYLLPDMDGEDALKKLVRHSERHAAVIVFTGIYDDPQFEQFCIEAGAQDVVIKSDLSLKHLARAMHHARTRHLLEYELQESQKKLKVLAESDNLTGLSNRYYFDKSLRSAISRAERYGAKLALLFIDLDDFKNINDNFGHDTGDELLKNIAKILQSMMRAGDDVCRLGGDEFAILLHRFDDTSDLIHLAERILEKLRLPHKIHQKELVISASIGIAIFPDSATDTSDLLKAADLAMYSAKKKGKNKWLFFSHDLKDYIQNRLRVENELRALIPMAHFVLFYQPIVDAKTFTVVGAESLLRWKHEVRGILPPDEFMDLANETGLIIEIDNRSRKMAFEQLNYWIKNNLVRSDFRLRLNICSQLLNDESLPRTIKSDLNLTGVTGRNIGIEVTESVIIDNIYSAAILLQEIRNIGVEIAVDDFGTGYSSMAYLKQLPANTIKIDKTFVQGVPENYSDTRILKAMIGLGKSLDLSVVVEGIETKEQARICSELGATFLQGYYFSRAVSPEHFVRFLSEYDAEAVSHVIFD
jgi:diguanylate cyclase (GGDEF)-like protein